MEAREISKKVSYFSPPDMVSFLPYLSFSSSLLILTAVALQVYTGFCFKLDICTADTCQNIRVPSHYLHPKM
jgi:hypothetical protein